MSPTALKFQFMTKLQQMISLAVIHVGWYSHQIEIPGPFSGYNYTHNIQSQFHDRALQCFLRSILQNTVYVFIYVPPLSCFQLFCLCLCHKTSNSYSDNKSLFSLLPLQAIHNKNSFDLAVLPAIMMWFCLWEAYMFVCFCLGVFKTSLEPSCGLLFLVSMATAFN